MLLSSLTVVTTVVIVLGSPSCIFSDTIEIDGIFSVFWSLFTTENAGIFVGVSSPIDCLAVTTVVIVVGSPSCIFSDTIEIDGICSVFWGLFTTENAGIFVGVSSAIDCLAVTTVVIFVGSICDVFSDTIEIDGIKVLELYSKNQVIIPI